MAAKATARTVSSMSAEAQTMAALLPPSSSKARANRPPATGATARPMAVEPVAETSGTWRSTGDRLADLALADDDGG